MSITAEEESEVLVWHRDRLKFLLMADPFLQVPLACFCLISRLRGEGQTSKGRGEICTAYSINARKCYFLGINQGQRIENQTN